MTEEKDPRDPLHDPLLAGVPTIEGFKVLDKVVLQQRIGRGGMGVVYRGHHRVFKIDVAVKVLKPELAASGDYVERFGREGDRARAGVASERLAELELFAGALEPSRRHASVAAQRLRGIDAHRASVLLATIQTAQGDLRAAETGLTEVLAAPDLDALSAWRAAAALSGVLRPQGRFSEARARIEAALPAARIQAPAPLFAGLLLAAAEIDVDLFRVGQARERLAQAQDAVLGGAPAPFEAAAALLAARLAGLANDPEGAVRILEPVIERIVSRELNGLAARLVGARGLHLLRLGRTDAAAADLSAAATHLRLSGALPALAELAVGRAEIADGSADPVDLFADVAAWMQMQPVRVLRLEYLLAAMRYADRRDDTGGSEAARVQAEAIYGQIRQLLAPEDETSLGVHPWRQTLRWG